MYIKTSSCRIHLQGVSPTLGAEVGGTGTVLLHTMVYGYYEHCILEDLLHAPSADYAFYSTSRAKDQGFQFDMNSKSNLRYARTELPWHRKYTLHGDLERQTAVLLIYTQFHLHWVLVKATGQLSYADGKAPLNVWHNRLGHV